MRAKETTSHIRAAVADVGLNKIKFFSSRLEAGSSINAASGDQIIGLYALHDCRKSSDPEYLSLTFHEEQISRKISFQQYIISSKRLIRVTGCCL